MGRRWITGLITLVVLGAACADGDDAPIETLPPPTTLAPPETLPPVATLDPPATLAPPETLPPVPTLPPMETLPPVETIVARSTELVPETLAPDRTVVAPTRPSTRTPCTPPTDGVHTITSGGVERRYLIRSPVARPAGQPLPVVVLLHGFASSAEEFSGTSGVAAAAAEAGVLLVAPQGRGEPAGWEIPNWEADRAFVDDVLDAVGATGCADTRSVWVGGHSAGSAFAAFYGCTRTDRVAGLWLNAALAPPLCGARTPAVVISHGTDDAVVPFDGGDQAASGDTFVLDPVPDAASAWAGGARCGVAETTGDVAVVAVTTYARCAAGSYVRLYTVVGGGHTWPGAPGATGIGVTSRDLDAACLLVTSAGADTAAPVDPDTCT